MSESVEGAISVPSAWPRTAAAVRACSYSAATLRETAADCAYPFACKTCSQALPSMSKNSYKGW